MAPFVFLFLISWFATNKLSYWGDIDAPGFQIPSMFREKLPDTASLFMDHKTLDTFGEISIEKDLGAEKPRCPINLTTSEKDVFNECVKENIHLEQDKISRTFVVEVLKQLSGAGFGWFLLMPQL